MFYNLNNIVKIKISNLLSVNNMLSMFNGCNSLISLNFNNFDSSSVTNMGWTFSGCNSLISLNLSIFNTSSVKYMYKMFYGCNSLISLDLSNFNTSSVKDMESMFRFCNSLISLDLTNFDTSSVTDMNYMFSECTSLISLDYNNFDTSSIQSINDIFYNCTSLIILNLNNSNLSKLSNNIFKYLNDNLVFCINESKFLSSYLTNFTNNCSYIELIIKDYKLIVQKKKFIDKCTRDNNYQFEYNKICYESCPKRTIQINNSFLCQDLNCAIYNFNQSESISNIPPGYFLNDSFLRTIDKCDDDCKTCNKKKFLNNSNCNSCKDDSKNLFFGKCLINCPIGFSPLLDNNSKICYNKCKLYSE